MKKTIFISPKLRNGLVSYQAFALGAAESQSCSGRCNSKLGFGLGTSLQQSFGVSPAAPDICARTQSSFTGDAGIDRDGFGVCLHYYLLSLATPAVAPLTLRLCHLRRTKYKFRNTDRFLPHGASGFSWPARGITA